MILEPQLRFAPETLLAAQGLCAGNHIGIRATLFDVDGVLTDGRLWIGAEGEIFKPFHALDGHGLKLLKQAHIAPVIITGRDSAAVRKRVSDLGIDHAYYGVHDKMAAAQGLLQSMNWDWGDVAVMGDDWPDLPIMTKAGFACAPPHAHTEVRSRAHYITQAAAGQGAARELCDLLLMAAGRYAPLLQGHLTTLDGN
jgi:3-deoxy-D-manno-octulosonate 8-phosphate phosphatase (KDO 8-P phosphatase)